MDLETIEEIKKLEREIRRKKDDVSRKSLLLIPDKKTATYKASDEDLDEYRTIVAKRNTLIQTLSPESQALFTKTNSSKKPLYSRSRIFASAPTSSTPAPTGVPEKSTTSLTR